MGVVAERPGDLGPDLRVGMRGVRRERLTQRRVLEARRELHDAGQRGLVQTAQQMQEMLHDGLPRFLQHAGVIRLHRRSQMGELLESRPHQHRALHALQGRDGGKLDRRMPVPQQPQHPADVARRRRDGQEPRALQALPPADRAVVGPHHARPPLLLQGAGQLLPPFGGDAGGPGDQRLDREGHRQPAQALQHLRGPGLTQGPALEHGVDEHALRVDPDTAPLPDPAVQNDEDDEGDEQRGLHRHQDDEELAARHLPTQRRIFSSATRKLMGFTR